MKIQRIIAQENGIVKLGFRLRQILFSHRTNSRCGLRQIPCMVKINKKEAFFYISIYIFPRLCYNLTEHSIVKGT